MGPGASFGLPCPQYRVHHESLTYFPGMIVDISWSPPFRKVIATESRRTCENWALCPLPQITRVKCEYVLTTQLDMRAQRERATGDPFKNV